MAITQASSLADFSTGIGTAGAVLKVDNADGRVGIGTTDPQADLQVGIAITMDGTAGVVTASSFSGSGANLTFTGADISAATASFTGNVSVGGTLTYEDVTNIDAVGVITARTGVKVTAGGVDVTAGGLNVTAGVSTFAADLSIADKIIHTGDTNTAIRFPAADTFTVETAGSEAFRVDSSQRLLVGATSGTAAFAGDANNLVIVESGNTAKIVVHRETEDAFGGILRLGKTRSSTSAIDNNDEVGAIEFFGHDSTDTNSRLAFIGCNAEADGATNDVPGRLVFATTADGAQSPTERLRVTSTGGVHFNNAELIERVNIVANKLSAVPNVNLDNGMVHYYTTNETTTANPNIITTAGINTNMATGDTMSVTILSKPNNAGYFPRISIDGRLAGITTYWSGGSAPSSAESSGVDVNVYQIIKTADETFDVLANTSNFA